MHIAIDARELAGKPTGVGTYLAHLLDEWLRMRSAAAHRWTLYVPENGGRPFDSHRGGALARGRQAAGEGRACPAEAAGRMREAHGGSQTAGVAPFERRLVRGRAGTWWEQRALAGAIRRDRPDVLFAPGYTAPLATTVPIVLTVHDVSFFARPDWFGPREGFRRRLITRWSARRARSIVTVSEFSKSEIVAWLGVPEARVHVIRHGISRPERPLQADCRPPIVLYVGSILNRRRVPDLIRVFASVLSKVPDARLEIVGDNRTHPQEDLGGLASSLGVLDRVMLRSYVADEELASLYGQARVFAFLSEYEGFGFTPLEALAHSVPIVVLDTPVAREVYGAAALYVPAGDLAATADALMRLLLDPGLRAAQLQQAEGILARYCWSEAARLTLDVIEQGGARG
jgi:glycosyltransferase involved in cell wall biosynthesis